MGKTMNGFCDLHTHSTFSDGTCTPTQLVAQAKELDLSAIVLSDHNTVAGLPEFMTLSILYGSTFSTRTDGRTRLKRYEESYATFSSAAE